MIGAITFQSRMEALRDWNDSSSMSISLRIRASIPISLSGIFRYSALTASPPPFPAA